MQKRYAKRYLNLRCMANLLPSRFFGQDWLSEHSTIYILALRYDKQDDAPKERRRKRPRLFVQQVVAHLYRLIRQQLVAQLIFISF